MEPLSLDEAYLDVSHLRSRGSAVAWEIRCQIEEETGLTASAGIASCKMLSKIASDWRKPDGQFEVQEDEVAEFMRALPVKKLPGVGRKTEEALAQFGAQTCGELQRFSKLELGDRFGKWGLELYALCRGRDDRPVRPNRIRKSLSTERTLRENVGELEPLADLLIGLREEIATARSARHGDRAVKSLVVKLKFSDFSSTTAERAHGVLDPEVYRELLEEAWSRRDGKAVRLIGAGVRFADPLSGDQLRLELE